MCQINVIITKNICFISKYFGTASENTHNVSSVNILSLKLCSSAPPVVVYLEETVYLQSLYNLF